MTTRLQELNLLDKTIFMEKWNKNCETDQIEKNKYYKYNNFDGWKAKYCQYKGCSEYWNMQEWNFHNLCDAAIFNYLNHLECYKDIVINKYKNALILEDDCILKDNFHIIGDVIQQKVDNNLEDGLIYFGNFMHHKLKGGEPHNVTSFKKVSKNLILTNESNVADSYMLSAAIANKILNSNTFPILQPIDHDMNFWFKSFEIKSYWCVPHLTEHGSLFKYISTDKSNVAAP
tara:strand:+ start:1300 stop:1992 length:693 start_codon:yes stop_codon:yes gene_type:complete